MKKYILCINRDIQKEPVKLEDSVSVMIELTHPVVHHGDTQVDEDDHDEHVEQGPHEGANVVVELVATSNILSMTRVEDGPEGSSQGSIHLRVIIIIL